MADRISPEKRSANMARVRSKNTKVELRVRRLLHAEGYRFRVHLRSLPGTPDIVFTKRKKAVFVHGCFWHSHAGCARAVVPGSRHDFWSAKLQRNRERDAASCEQLSQRGWRFLIVWECQTKDSVALMEMLKEFLGPPSM